MTATQGSEAARTVPATMVAARLHARQDLRVDRIPVPAPSASEALIRVLWCGICGTDLEEYRDGPVTVPMGTPHPVSGRLAPLTLGHEPVGVIARAAADGSGPAAGTVVVPDVVSGCGTCWWCRRHDEGQCQRLVVIGQTTDGALAHYLVARADRCLPVPDGLAAETAALAEPTAVAVRALAKLGAAPQAISSLAVLGGGTIGQLVARVARSLGCRSVTLVDPVPERRRLAERTGIGTVHPSELARFAATLPEPGLDAAIECTGRPGVIADALRSVRRGGEVVALGLRAALDTFQLDDFVLGEKRLIGSAAHMWDTDLASALDLLASGRLSVDGLITHRIPLAQTTDALELLGDTRSGAVKVLVDCS
ncbi:zinc-binding dehydrogenase [Herbiconiux sp. UC225_62]|uniref:zinc-dependent alcohol dehydrogenase n=1 Tax=Herbiconiux sp. UC225_62 TaxID=3350168 RepID=UPI0036D3E95D